MNIEIRNFKLFLQKNKCIIPVDFSASYYILTKNNYISLIDCIHQLKISRDALLKTLKRSYTKNVDFIEIQRKKKLIYVY